MDFRFSPRPNDAHRIEWRAWGDEAFADAQAADRPLLLSISAVWCHWCHVMDETTFSDPDVIDTLNRLFVCVRVDNDRRPDVNRRYNMGGWPTVAFLTPTGEIMTGATYVPAGQFADLARAVDDVWRRKATDIRHELQAVRERRAREHAAAPVGDVTPALVAAALAPLYEAYDPQSGGFGDHMKFPRTDALDALLAEAETRPDQVRPQEMLARTLEAMRDGGLWDQVEGGFFRYATRRDWTVPHYEKMLEDNAQLIRVFAEAAVVLDRPDFVEAAAQAHSYLDVTLWQTATDGSGLYGGSQDADEEYYALPTAEQRQARPAPYVDPMTYTDWNAQAARALVALGLADDQRAVAQAAAMVRTLLARRDAAGLFAHDAGPHAATDLLGDQVSMLEALLALARATGSREWIDEAVAVARALDERFASPGSPLFADLAAPPAPPAAAAADTPDAPEGEPLKTSETPGPAGVHLDRRETPPAENARAAVAFARLARLTREPALAERARQLAAGLAPLVDKVGDFTGPIASAAIAVVDEPWHVSVVGAREEPDVQALYRAAARLPRPSLTLELLDPSTEGDLIASLGLAGSDHDTGPRAYLCVGMSCSAPVTSPDELARLAATYASRAATTTHTPGA